MNEKVNDEQNSRNDENGIVSKISRFSDLPDTPHDEERMKAEEVIIDMPDVSDIPGQEHIVVPEMLEMQDVTISSDDEEGVGIFDDEEEEDEIMPNMGTEADVSQTEITMLEKSADDETEEDDTILRQAELDNEDSDGEPLNEGSFATDVSGGDLDTSGVDSDDPMEAIGEEDEENNTYSLGSESNDNLNEGTP